MTVRCYLLTGQHLFYGILLSAFQENLIMCVMHWIPGWIDTPYLDLNKLMVGLQQQCRLYA